jgi:hypothetical protein
MAKEGVADQCEEKLEELFKEGERDLPEAIISILLTYAEAIGYLRCRYAAKASKISRRCPLTDAKIWLAAVYVSLLDAEVTLKEASKVIGKYLVTRPHDKWTPQLERVLVNGKAYIRSSLTSKSFDERSIRLWAQSYSEDRLPSLPTLPDLGVGRP